MHGSVWRRPIPVADPEVFLVNFGPRFNAGVPGEVLLGSGGGRPRVRGRARQQRHSGGQPGHCETGASWWAGRALGAV